MATSAAVKATIPAVAEWAQGEQPSRTKSLLAAAVIGVTAAAVTYRVLRSASSPDGADE
jgi:hypothetical protein